MYLGRGTASSEIQHRCAQIIPQMNQRHAACSFPFRNSECYNLSLNIAVHIWLWHWTTAYCLKIEGDYFSNPEKINRWVRLPRNLLSHKLFFQAQLMKMYIIEKKYWKNPIPLAWFSSHLHDDEEYLPLNPTVNYQLISVNSVRQN